MRSPKANDLSRVRSAIHSERLHAENIIDKTSIVWGRYDNLVGQYRVNRRSAIIAVYSGMNPSKKVLEIGSGTGEYTKSFSKHMSKIFSVDISWDFLDLAKKRHSFTNNKFCQAAVEFMPFKDNAYDAVVGNAILHHLNLEYALKEVHRVLKPGMPCVFIEPNMLNPQIAVQKNIKFVKKLSGDSLNETAFFSWRIKKALIKADFNDVYVKPIDFLHPAIPDFLFKFAKPICIFLEKVPLIKEFSGSLLIYARNS